MNFAFYSLPNLNARIGIAVQGLTLAITLLSEGCSRKGKPGAFEYTRRNPDRRKAANVLLTADGIGKLALQPYICRGGKTSNKPGEVASVADVLAAFRKGGNYRFELQTTLNSCVPSSISGLPTLDTVEAVADALGLEPVANRPVAVVWFTGSHS